MIVWIALAVMMALAGMLAWRLVLARREMLSAEQAIASHIAANADLARGKAVAEAANEAKTRYLASVSHEIRSPLNTIYGYAQLLERDETLSGAEAGGVIRRSAEHLGNLVEGLLEISKIEGGVMKIRSDEIEIRRLLDHVVEMFHMQAASKGVSLRLTIADGLPDCVRSDEKKLRQILINLVSNAVKYTQRGSVEIKVGYRSQIVDIEVRDTGIGIAADDLERVFEPFERGSSAEAQRQPGIGLGLAITRVLAGVLGGDLAATSTPGEGSCFRLRLMLPARAAQAGEAVPADSIKGYQGARRSVLVVDDDPAQSGILQSLLRPAGFVVHIANDGLQAIELAERHKPDIALLDIQMPGMTGWELAARLRAAHGRAIRIVMASANVHEFRAGGDGDSNHDAFVTKPIDLNALLALVGVQLGLRWEKAEPEIAAEAPQLPEKLPSEASPFVGQLRHLAQVGHVRGIETALTDFEDKVPAAAPLVSVLRGQLNDLDLRSFIKKLDDAKL